MTSAGSSKSISSPLACICLVKLDRLLGAPSGKAARCTALRRGKDDDFAFVPWAAAFPVAASRRLNDPVKRPDSAQDTREVQVDPAFDQAGADKQCRQAVCRGAPEPGRAPPGGDGRTSAWTGENVLIVCAIRVQHVHKLTGLAAGVEDAQAGRPACISSATRLPISIPPSRVSTR